MDIKCKYCEQTFWNGMGYDLHIKECESSRSPALLDADQQTSEKFY